MRFRRRSFRRKFRGRRSFKHRRRSGGRGSGRMRIGFRM